MKKISIIVGIIILAIVGVILVKDILIKKELSQVPETQVLETETPQKNVVQKSDSTITIQRYQGEWFSDYSGEYMLDTKSLEFKFVGYKPGGEHIGTFNDINGEISVDTEGNPVQARIVLDTVSVKTDAVALDTHLQTPDFFNAAQYNFIDAFIKEIKVEGDTKEAVVDLTMKGVTKTLIVPITITPGQDGVMFSVDTRVKISDYNIAYGPVLDEVRIMLKGKIVKK